MEMPGVCPLEQLPYRISLPWALIALMIKYLEIWGVVDLKVLDFLNTGEIYGGFTFVLGRLPRANAF